MILTVNNLEFTYGKDSSNERTINIEKLELDQGEVKALTGVSGSGKSTILECIGLIRKGFKALDFQLDDQVIYGGLNRISEKQYPTLRATRIGYMPQTGGLLPYLTFKENIELQIEIATKLRGESKAKRKEYWDNIVELIKNYGMSELLVQYPEQLSIGQRQRATFFKSLSHKPKLVLIDEPTSALDPENSDQIFETIKNVAKEQTLAILIVTHDLERVHKYSISEYTAEISSQNKSISVFKEKK